MNPQQTAKTFDCLQFKRQAQSEIYNEIKKLTVEEQLAYFRRRAESGSLAKWWRAVKSPQRKQGTLDSQES